ncbi:MAG: AAA family ATPase [Syntrophaceae bacterium]|nr:AAA family ATPase [Syntrophaceae bacterium]
MTHPRLTEAMKQPDFYPHHPREVEFIQTHISYIFIAGDFVYKIKKPLKFDFLDFTSLEKRKHFCEEELKLNRRLAPATYLDVVAISRNSAGHITLDKGTDIIEYAVRMKKLPADRMLRTLLSRGMANEKIMDSLARKIALFHQQARTGKDIDEMGRIENIRHNNEENFDETVNYINITIPEYQYNFIQDYVHKFLMEKETFFQKRIHDHKIRDCHGDLHLDHICINDDITIFDCIEFNERFRYGDVAEDVAFLTMDIDFNGYPEYAERFVQSYVKYSSDSDMLKLLNFYRCYYAYVRGKVTSLRLSQKEITKKERWNITNIGKRYFDLAYTYATRLEKPALIITAGLMGSGKSYQARELAKRLGTEIIRTDLLRKDLFNIKTTEKHYEDFGKGIYSENISRLVYDKAFDFAKQKIKQGKAVIIDASFKKRSEREKAMETARELDVCFYIIECICSDHVTKNRLGKRMRNNDNPSDGRWELFQEQKNDFDVINEVPSNCHFIIDTTSDPETIRQKIIRKIKFDESRV